MEEPRIQFPCPYPIKVMVRTDPAVRSHVDAVMARHAGAEVIDTVAERPSAQGNFAGLTYTIEAQGEAQLAAIFADLKAVAGVLMVL